jgi:hypothetical protein
MNQGMIYKKSAQGSQAIAARDRNLTPRLRSLLIMVDGKRSPAELAQLTAQPDVAPLLDQLLQMGMVEEAAPASPAPAVQAAATPSAAPATGATVPLADAKRFAVRKLTDLLGPAAEDLCIKIEAARNAADFMAVIHRVETMLREIRGARQADEFTAAIQDHRPA